MDTQESTNLLANNTIFITRKTWEEFRDAGLWWWLNRTLHLFGWVLVREEKDNGTIIAVYPARTKFRGLSEDIEEKGFKKISKYLKDNIDELYQETIEDDSNDNKDIIE